MAKTNFGLCPSVFVDIFVHLASIGNAAFENHIAASFHQLSSIDPRFSVLIRAINIINLPGFRERSICRATAAQIALLNSVIHRLMTAHAPILEAIVREVPSTFHRTVAMFAADVDVTDVETTAFLANNLLESFEPACAAFVTESKVSEYSWIADAIPCIPNAKLLESNIPALFIRLGVSSDPYISAAVVDGYARLIADDAALIQTWVKAAVRLIQEDQAPETTAYALVLIADAMRRHPMAIHPNPIEPAAFVALLNEIAVDRVLIAALLSFTHR
jgi:hypothetical protein